MALTLTTYTGKGEELTYDDMDNNWGLIMDAFNGMGAQQLYQLQDLTGANACQEDGSNVITLSCKVKILQAYAINPILRYTVTLNDLIVSADQVSGYFTGKAFPFAQNTEGGELLNLPVQIQAIQYPATIKVYLIDEKSNYAQPVTLVIADNPCLTPAEEIVLNHTSVVGGNLAINIDLSNGSNDYDVQYLDGAVWTKLASVVQVDGTNLTQIIPFTISGSYMVRLIDTLTLNTSNQILTDF